MDLYAVIDQIAALLQKHGRITYRALKLQFALDNEHLEALKEELIEARELAVDKDGKMLVWTGTPSEQPAGSPKRREAEAPEPQRALHVEAERRQLTVLFCDLVGATALSTQLDPEDYRAVVQQYQQTCMQVIQRHDGYLAQYLGDGLLVYFGYPVAHEDDARRAVRTGLEILEALGGQKTEKGKPLHVRIGIHTGLVVVGEIGVGSRTEQLALGETPNVAARIQGLAEPNTVMVSAATQRLIADYVESQPFGSHLVKGLETPVAVYHIQSERQSVSPLAGRTTLTPLVGRDQEVGLLLDRWEQVKEGCGHVVLLSGEPGIGKSRLAYTLREHVTKEGSLLFEVRCSPYHQQSALYPLIDVLQRTLLFTRSDTDTEKIDKLERALALYGMPESVPLFTALLSLPTPPQYPPLTLMPQKQKERTLYALVQALVAQAERQATVAVWEDVHWADPSSLEFLSLLIDTLPTTKLLLVLTFRPEFTPLWKPRSHLSYLVLNRLGKRQVEVMIEKVTAGTDLAAEVIDQIGLKTDGVPLFVEEVTKSVMETIGAHGRAPLQTLAIPVTLQEALLARLDRLSTARQVAQLGATLGREFSHELLQAVAPMGEAELHAALSKLVEAEILYQRGVGEQARYFFKHALIQDTAYQSLLKSTRQQYHHQIAQVLEERFPETQATQPELLAHHYTEASLIEAAIPYWQQAGQRASERWANAEAIRYLTTGLTLLRTLPETPARIQRELTLHALLGTPLMLTRGWGAPEVKQTLTRAVELSQHSEETPQLFPVLYGLAAYYGNRAEFRTALELIERCLRLADRTQDSGLRLTADYMFQVFLAHKGELVRAREYCEQRLRQYDPTLHGALAFRFGIDPGVVLTGYAALTAWYLGYPDQALTRGRDTWTLAQDRSHPPSQASGALLLSWVHFLRHEPALAQERIESAITLLTAAGEVMVLAMGTMIKGAAVAEQGHTEDGLALLQQGWSALQAIGSRMLSSNFLLMMARVYGGMGRAEEGLAALAEAEVFIAESEERWEEAELYRLKGELTLQQFQAQSSECKGPSTQHPPSRLQTEAEAEACFLKAIDIARQQQAKSWELRAATSLARLWQQQGKHHEARTMLSDIYNWFTEGFDTKDLQEAKALLEELEGSH